MSTINLLTFKGRRRLIRFYLPVAIAVLSALLLVEASSLIQQSDNLFTPVSPERVAALPETARRQPETVVRQRYVTVNFAYFRSQVLAARRARRVPRKVAVTLFEDVRVMLDPTNVKRNKDGVYLWESEVEAKTLGRAMLALNERTAMGTIEIDDKIYEINTVSADIVSISEIDPRKFQNELPPITPPRKQTSSVSKRTGAKRALSPRRRGSGPTASTITLSVLTILPLPQYSNTCFDIFANAAYKANITQNLNGVFNYFPTGVQSVVNVACIEYTPQGGDLTADLGWVSTDPTVAAYRDKFQADLVSLQVPDGDGCGRGNYNPPPVSSADESRAFSVVKWSCARSNYSLAHEIGHNMGMHHDRIEEQAAQSPDCNFGYIAASDVFRTVMSYPTSCGGCKRWGAYSTPQFKKIRVDDVVLNFGPFGVACDAPPDGNGNYSRANNLAQFVTAAPVVSGFR